MRFAESTKSIKALQRKAKRKTRNENRIEDGSPRQVVDRGSIPGEANFEGYPPSARPGLLRRNRKNDVRVRKPTGDRYPG
jgi:hypothetical protein